MNPGEVLPGVDAVVTRLLADARWAGPPVDALRLAQQHLGLTVCLDQGQNGRGRIQRSAFGWHIYLRPEPCEERHQWTVAHEIGEFLRRQLLECAAAEVKTDPLLGEELANLFASRLLVPSCWFNTDAPLLAYDVLALKRLYRTASHEVIAWRLLDLPAPAIVTIVDNTRLRRRRSNAWRVLPVWSPVEDACQRQTQTTGQPCRISANGWTVQGWPVHKPDWKREILRLVWEGDE